MLNDGMRVKVKTDWYLYNKIARNIIEGVINQNNKKLPKVAKINILKSKISKLDDSILFKNKVIDKINKVIAVIENDSVESLLTDEGKFFIGNV